MTPLEDDMLDAMKAAHSAMDWLFARLAVHTDLQFMPSQSPAWPAMVQLHCTIQRAEAIRVEDAWAQLKRIHTYLDQQTDLAYNAYRSFREEAKRELTLVGRIVISDHSGPYYDQWIGTGDARELIGDHLRTHGRM